MTKRLLASALALTVAISMTVYGQWTWITSLVSTTQIQAVTTSTAPVVMDEATQQMLDESAQTIDTDAPAAGHVLSLSR